ncbi:HNH endonuclease [Streptomyces sp. NPDC002088]|uniref:HNH endonuclease n=1 Tax=Streptomyces sp. NPDC002088 TaxID=3154665 RepID=UPI003331BD5F
MTAHALRTASGRPGLLVHSSMQQVRRYHVDMEKTCSVPACERPHYGRGYCNLHYQRWRAHGDPTTKNNMRNEPAVERFWSKVAKTGSDECWPYTANTTRLGYGMFHLNGRNQPAHRVAFFLTHGRWPEPHCLHSCDNPPCCNPAHLSEGTHQENMRQMVERDRRTPSTGESHPAARLTEEDLAEARQLRDQGWKLSDLSQRYGISLSAIGRALQGRSWTETSSGYKPAIKRAGAPKRGVDHPMAKVTPEIVAEIRRRADGGEPRGLLQLAFGLSKSTIQRIVTRTGWRDDE